MLDVDVDPSQSEELELELNCHRIGAQSRSVIFDFDEYTERSSAVPQQYSYSSTFHPAGFRSYDGRVFGTTCFSQFRYLMLQSI